MHRKHITEGSILAYGSIFLSIFRIFLKPKVYYELKQKFK